MVSVHVRMRVHTRERHPVAGLVGPSADLALCRCVRQALFLGSLSPPWSRVVVAKL